MSDLIERQAAIKAVNNAFDRETLLTGFVRSIAVRAIRDMPSAQPEQKKGKWKVVGKDMYINLENAREQYRDLGYPHRNELKLRCSECGMLTIVDESIAYNYCPHCGAKMEGETE